jgi:ABC-type glycerol-3-phosphate transport system substrate-binding protein
MSKFQLILISIFVLFIVAGVVAFSLFKSSSGQTSLSAITVWGTLPNDKVMNFITQVNSTRIDQLPVTYVEKSEATFESEFVNALANGRGPDAILIPQDMILANENKLLLIPYTAMTQRDFTDTYVSETELYLRTEGITAIPFTIDPLVMYWNRDLFTNAGIASAGTIKKPLLWSQLAQYGLALTQKDVNSNIKKSVLAMGDFQNVNHAREILSTLLFQAGNPVTVRAADNSVSSAFGNGLYQGLTTSQPAVQFFTKFADPTSPIYSWNRSLPTSQSWFLSGNLATYFGFASELQSIRSKNPNLNFDAAPLPQADNPAVRTTYGRLYGFSLVKNSANPSAAYTILQYLTSADSLAMWSSENYLPSVRRDVIGAGTTDPYLTIFNDGALISRGWLDPSPANSSALFSKMIESITSGSQQYDQAIQQTSDAIDLMIKSI